MRALGVIVLALAGVAAVRGAENADAQLLVDFGKRVSAFMEVHEKIRSALPIRPTNSARAIAEREREFAKRLASARAGAKQGDIFTPPIAAEFRRLIGLAMQADAARIRTSLRHAEPVAAHLEVNRPYPANIPLQSSPPSLLANLPALPGGLEYRLVGHALILRDAAANLVIDIVPDAIS